MLYLVNYRLFLKDSRLEVLDGYFQLFYPDFVLQYINLGLLKLFTFALVFTILSLSLLVNCLRVSLHMLDLVREGADGLFQFRDFLEQLRVGLLLFFGFLIRFFELRFMPSICLLHALGDRFNFGLQGATL